MACNRLILVACTDDMFGVLDLTIDAINDYAYKCGAELDIFHGLPKKYQHGKYRIFEAATIDYSCIGYKRVLIMDADIKPKPDAPDIFAEYPTGNWMLNEMAFINHSVSMHQAQVRQYLMQAKSDIRGLIWPNGVWWNPGVALLDVADIPKIYQMPPWDVTKNLYRVGDGACVKNMPVVNANIVLNKVNVQAIDKRYNTASTDTQTMVDKAYFVHYMCQQLAENRNEIKINMLKKEESKGDVLRIHCIIGNEQHAWILGKMFQALIRYSPNNVVITYGELARDEEGVINWYVPYRGYRGKSRYAKDVVFCTHPQLADAWNKSRQEADHVICMCEQYMAGLDPERATLIYPGVDDCFLDARLRIFCPVNMQGEHRPGRKGKRLWDSLCALPWLDCVCSNGMMKLEEVLREYRACDAVVITSEMEGGPMAIWEAAAMGKPIFIRDGVGAFELVDKDHRYETDTHLMMMLAVMQKAKKERIEGCIARTQQQYANDVWSVFYRVAGVDIPKPVIVEPEPVQEAPEHKQAKLRRATGQRRKKHAGN